MANGDRASTKVFLLSSVRSILIYPNNNGLSRTCWAVTLNRPHWAISNLRINDEHLIVLAMQLIQALASTLLHRWSEIRRVQKSIRAWPSSKQQKNVRARSARKRETMIQVTWKAFKGPGLRLLTKWLSLVHRKYVSFYRYLDASLCDCSDCRKIRRKLMNI